MVMVDPDCHAFEFLKDVRNYIGDFISEGSIDAKLLIELETKAGVISVELARGHLARLNGNIYNVKNFRKIRRIAGSATPRRHGW